MAMVLERASAIFAALTKHLPYGIRTASFTIAAICTAAFIVKAFAAGISPLEDLLCVRRGDLYHRGYGSWTFATRAFHTCAFAAVAFAEFAAKNFTVEAFTTLASLQRALRKS